MKREERKEKREKREGTRDKGEERQESRDKRQERLEKRLERREINELTAQLFLKHTNEKTNHSIHRSNSNTILHKLRDGM